jgi:hypothetical protein
MPRKHKVESVPGAILTTGLVEHSQHPPNEWDPTTTLRQAIAYSTGDRIQIGRLLHNLQDSSQALTTFKSTTPSLTTSVRMSIIMMTARKSQVSVVYPLHLHGLIAS